MIDVCDDGDILDEVEPFSCGLPWVHHRVRWGRRDRDRARAVCSVQQTNVEEEGREEGWVIGEYHEERTGESG